MKKKTFLGFLVRTKIISQSSTSRTLRTDAENFENPEKRDILANSDLSNRYPGNPTKYQTKRFSDPIDYMDENVKENVPPLPRGFIRASDYPQTEDGNFNLQKGTRHEMSRFTDENKGLQQDNSTLHRKGKLSLFEEKEEISDYPPRAQIKLETDSRQFRADRKPFRDITDSHQNQGSKGHSQGNYFGIASSHDSRKYATSDNPSVLIGPPVAPEEAKRDTSFSHMPLVPYRTYRQETHDEDDMYNSERNHRSKTYHGDDDGSERNTKSSKKHSRSHNKNESDSEDSSTQCSKSSYASRDRMDKVPTLYSLLQEMECPATYLDALTQMKLMLKRPDLPEVLPPRYASDKGRRRQVRYIEYFPEKFTGKASKLRRYLQRYLQYSSQVANDDQTRADILAEGIGLSDTCLTQLEYSAKVPLPGFADIYDDSTVSQKKRTLDILLTYVFLFHQEEPNAAVNDLRLEGPMLTGLLDLYHQLHRGSVTLPSKLVEDYLTRGILRASNGQGVSLISNFQGQLRLHKRLSPGWDKDDTKYRSLLFNCCSELTVEAKSVPIPSNIPTGMQQTSLKGGGRRDNRTEHNVNQAQVHWEDELELYEEYAALATTMTRTDERPRYNEGRRQRDGRDRNRDRDRQDNNRKGEQKESREAYVVRVFCTAPCACCGSNNHAMLSPIKAPDGTRLNSEYICPVAMCDNWEEARILKPPKLRFAPCPKKFAAVNKYDTHLIQAALNDYAERGSGKFRDLNDRLTFKNEVLSMCKNSQKSAGGTRVVGSVNKEERCNSGQVEVKPPGKQETTESDPENDSESENSPGGTKLVRLVKREERDNLDHVEMADQDEVGTTERFKEDMEETIEGEPEGCVIIETYNAHGVTKAPSPLTHSSLHLMIASRVEPSSREEIKSFLNKEFEETILRKFENVDEEDDGTGCWVLMEMTYGAEYIVPYKVVHGRILADTGSTTTLINEDFARKQGLDIRSTGAGQILLRDVNDGTSELTKQCFLRLTVTTVEGELISFTVLAFCTDRLKHDILLGTRDLERYKIDVSSHRGEAKMELRDGTVAFPMLDATQITHLQHLALGGSEDC